MEALINRDLSEMHTIETTKATFEVEDLTSVESWKTGLETAVSEMFDDYCFDPDEFISADQVKEVYEDSLTGIFKLGSENLTEDFVKSFINEVTDEVFYSDSVSAVDSAYCNFHSYGGLNDFIVGIYDALEEMELPSIGEEEVRDIVFDISMALIERDLWKAFKKTVWEGNIDLMIPILGNEVSKSEVGEKENALSSILEEGTYYNGISKWSRSSLFGYYDSCSYDFDDREKRTDYFSQMDSYEAFLLNDDVLPIMLEKDMELLGERISMGARRFSNNDFRAEKFLNDIEGNYSTLIWHGSVEFGAIVEGLSRTDEKSCIEGGVLYAGDSYGGNSVPFSIIEVDQSLLRTARLCEFSVKEYSEDDLSAKIYRAPEKKKKESSFEFVI